MDDQALARYDRNVFLNCPYDKHYKKILDAILFCIHDCGYQARFALEESGNATRLEKLLKMIEESRFSIHDLSRVNKRLNMAFEYGLCVSAQRFGNDHHSNKDSLILDVEPHNYKKYLSDVAGKDGKAHGNDPVRAINAVRTFLCSKSKIIPVLSASQINRRYVRFSKGLPKMAKMAPESYTLSELKKFENLPDLVNLMVAWQTANTP